MRRNSDERFRELERRVIAGDLTAVIQLHQERKRAGQQRDLYTPPTFLVAGPRGFGELAISPFGVNEIRVVFGEEADIGTGGYYEGGRRKVTPPPYVVRGVAHRGDIRFLLHDPAEGWVALGPVEQTRTYRDDKMGFVYRTDRFHEKASPAAREAIRRALTPFVNQWAAAHERDLLEAELGQADNDVQRADKEVAKAIAVLDEAQRQLSSALVHELRISESLRSMPPRAENPGDDVVFYHGTPRAKLASVLRKGLEPSHGWGGAATFGVYLSGSREGALYWAKIAWQVAHGQKMEASRFDRAYGDRVGELLAIVEVRVPAEAVSNLRADMEQAEDVGFEGDENDWEASLAEIGDVMYDGRIPAAWLREVELP